MFAGRRVRAMRMALAIAGMFVAAAAGATEAADYRIGPAPAWVHPVPFDTALQPQGGAANVAHGTRFDVVDDQVRLTPTSRVRFHHVVSQAVTDKGIDDLSHREIEVDPSWESLVISQMDVIRDGQRASRLRDMQVKVLQRERDLASRIYDGRKSIVIDLPDIRVGDVVEFAFARAGANPVFAGHHGGAFEMRLEVPVARLYRRLSSSTGMKLTVTPMNGASMPQFAQADGFDERTWDVRDVPGLHRESSVPDAYNAYPWAEWSDFASWGEVARWAEPLYRAPAQLSPALRDTVDAIARQSPGDEDRIVAVLRTVQQQVRYLGVEIGVGTHSPSPPDAVWARRWGDCKEKSLLVVTMLRALGIEAAPALVNTDRGTALDGELPNANAFDHVVTRVHYDGRDYWLDPTLAPQQGTLHTVSQPDYGSALLLDGRSTGLARMPAATLAAHAREVQIDVDSSAGVSQPVKYDVRTTYHAFAADRMRNDLGDGERDELQHRYVNFYAKSYPGIQVAAPIEVSDDARANTVVVTEHYTIKDFWPVDDKGGRQAWFQVPELDDQLVAPNEPIRTMPLSLRGPQAVHEQVRVQLPLPWPERRLEKTVSNDAFKLTRAVQVRGRVLTTDYLLEITKDQVEPAAVKGFAADVGRAQDLLGYGLNTARADTPTLGVSGVESLRVVGMVAVLCLAGWWIASMRRSREGALAGGATTVAPDVVTPAPPRAVRGRASLWLLLVFGLGFSGYWLYRLGLQPALPELSAWGVLLRSVPLAVAGAWAGVRLWQTRDGRVAPALSWRVLAARSVLLAMYVAGVLASGQSDVLTLVLAAWLAWVALGSARLALALRKAPAGG